MQPSARGPTDSSTRNVSSTMDTKLTDRQLSLLRQSATPEGLKLSRSDKDYLVAYNMRRAPGPLIEMVGSVPSCVIRITVRGRNHLAELDARMDRALAQVTKDATVSGELAAARSARLDSESGVRSKPAPTLPSTTKQPKQGAVKRERGSPMAKPTNVDVNATQLLLLKDCMDGRSRSAMDPQDQREANFLEKRGLVAKVKDKRAVTYSTSASGSTLLKDRWAGLKKDHGLTDEELEKHLRSKVAGRRGPRAAASERKPRAAKPKAAKPAKAAKASSKKGPAKHPRGLAKPKSKKPADATA